MSDLDLIPDGWLLIASHETGPCCLLIKGLLSLANVRSQTVVQQTVSDLWIVPIFLDFCRLCGRGTLGLSACDSADCPVLPFVGMGVAKKPLELVSTAVRSYGILLNAAAK